LSAINQSDRDIEIVVIDDGSTDDTAAIIKKYLPGDERIKYYYQTNRGIAATRNYALQLVNGRYFTFMDGDDVIAPDFARHVANTALGIELIIFDFEEQDPGGEMQVKRFDARLLQLASENPVNTSFIIADKYPNLWAKAYSTHFVRSKNLSFFHTKTLEDMFFMLDILMNKPVIAHIPYVSYSYLYVGSSISRRISLATLTNRQDVVTYYMDKYIMVNIRQNTFFVTFWVNRIFMQFYLVLSSASLSGDRETAYRQTLSYIGLMLEKMRIAHLFKNRLDLLLQLRTNRARAVLCAYSFFRFWYKISKRFSYRLFAAIHSLMRFASR